jgi:hypothetical protein
MKLIDFLHQLDEAKFRQPIEMYHGTSTKFLRSILKNGVMPFPKEKVWADDPKASMMMFSRASFGGSYWASNLRIAISAANQSKDKFGGNKLIVIGKISEQSAFADEDSLSMAIRWALDDALREIYQQNLSPDFVSRSFALQYYKSDEETKKQMIETYAKFFHERSAINPEHHKIDMNMFKNLVEALLLRDLAYIKEEYKDSWMGDNYVKTIEKIENGPEIPSIREGEMRFEKLREQLTRTYRKTTLKTIDAYNHTLRLEVPVNYRGSNRIISIVEYVESKLITLPKEEGEELKRRWIYYPMILHYGTGVTEQFLNFYKESVGEFPGLVTPDGREIIPVKEPKDI